MSEPKGFVPFPDEGKTEDLPREIQDDIKKSIKAYFSTEVYIDEDGWDMERGTKVMLEKKTNQIVFLKKVMNRDGDKIMVCKFDKKIVDKWMEE